jgi:flagellar hook protein FlgE
VQGWTADGAGNISTGTATGDLQLPTGLASPPTATTEVTFGGNLSSSAAVGTVVASPVTIYDSLGAAQKITVSMTKSGDNSWDVSVTNPDGTVQPGPTLTFDPATGGLTDSTPPSFTIPGSGGGSDTSIAIDLGTVGSANSLTQFGSSSSAAALSQDGEQAGTLQSYSIGPDGTVSGTFSNGVVKPLARIALATFADPAGLLQAGNNNFAASAASGTAVLSAPGTGSTGTLQSGALEMSNVDLAQEFTNLIIAQRGFEANAKVISASDQILQALVNMNQ